MDITPRHIDQIEALHRYGSFAQAARKLYISQPALSRSILNLEEKLGLPLFDRLPGRLVPTVFARIILDRGGTILRDIELMHRDIMMLHGGEAGTVHIGCGPFPAEVFVADALSRFSNRFPKLTVKVTVDPAPRLISLLRERDLDFIVAETHQIDGIPEFEIVMLPQQQGYFCCRQEHPLASSQSLALTDILAYPLALMWLPDRVFSLFGDLLGREISGAEDLQPNGLIQCDNLSTLFGTAGGSNAVTIATREVLARSVYRDRLLLLPLLIPGFTTNYGIVSLPGYSVTPAIKHLKKLLVAGAAETTRLPGDT